MQDLSLPIMDTWFKIMMMGIVWTVLLLLAFLYEKREKRKKEEKNDNIEKAANAIHEEAKEKLQEKIEEGKLQEKIIYNIENIYQDYFNDEDNVKKQIENKIIKIINDDLEDLVIEKVRGRINRSIQTKSILKYLNDQVEEKIEKVTDETVEKVLIEEQLENQTMQIINDDLEDLVIEKVRSRINGCINKSFQSGSTIKLLNIQIEENLEKFTDGMVEKTLVEQQEDIKEKIEEAIQKRLSINLQKRVKEKINNHINETIEQAINENHKALTFNILGEFDKKIDEEFLQKYAERNNNNLTVKNDNEVKLSKIEKRVLEMRFELCDNKTQTLEEIGTDIGCTRERIRQLQKNAIQKLVNMYKNNFVSNLTNNKVELFEIEKRILKMRSGLDGDKVMSLTKVERIIGCTHKQIKQHQKNAIQKLMKMYKNNNQPEEKK